MIKYKEIEFIVSKDPTKYPALNRSIINGSVMGESIFSDSERQDILDMISDGLNKEEILDTISKW